MSLMHSARKIKMQAMIKIKPLQTELNNSRKNQWRETVKKLVPIHQEQLVIILGK